MTIYAPQIKQENFSESVAISESIADTCEGEVKIYDILRCAMTKPYDTA